MANSLEECVMIPTAPTDAAIEAMIEALLTNKNDVKAAYKALVRHHKQCDQEWHADAPENRILRIEIGNGKFNQSATQFVALDVFIGAKAKMATGYLSPLMARDLAEKLCHRAGLAEGKV